MKLLGSTKSKISKDEDGKNVLHLEITEVVLPHCKMIVRKIQEYCTLLFRIKRLVLY